MNHRDSQASHFCQINFCRASANIQAHIILVASSGSWRSTTPRGRWLHVSACPTMRPSQPQQEKSSGPLSLLLPSKPSKGSGFRDKGDVAMHCLARLSKFVTNYWEEQLSLVGSAGVRQHWIFVAMQSELAKIEWDRLEKCQAGTHLFYIGLRFNNSINAILWWCNDIWEENLCACAYLVQLWHVTVPCAIVRAAALVVCTTWAWGVHINLRL